MFHLELNSGDKWDLWPFPFHSFALAVTESRKLLGYMKGPVQMKLIHSLDGSVVWLATRA
jgi:hypothetical protein